MMRKTSPTQTASPSEFMNRLMGVIEILDPPAAASAGLRDRLIQSAAVVCEEQGIVANAQQVARAVDAQLNAEPVSPLNSTFDFGWNRPKTADELSRRTRKMESGGWAALRFLRGAPDQLLPTLAAAALGALVAAILCGDWILSITSPSHPDQARILLAGIMMFIGGAVGVPLGHHIGRWVEKNYQGLQEIAPTSGDTKRWKEHPETRQYVRQCLFSAIPMILAQDEKHLDSITARLTDAGMEARVARSNAESKRAFRKAFLDEVTN